MPPMSSPIIEARDVGKIFGDEQRDGLLNVFARRRSARQRSPIVALRGASLTLLPGRIYGVIGPNGAGKSTLLRILGRVLPPTAGRVVGRGRVAALFGADQFIEMDQTGRNNIYNQARLLGWKEREIAPRVGEIIDFAGLSKFVDVKVARYSRGMQLRLNFSIAANLGPDLLLLDDVLAVGDKAFQNDALVRLRELADRGAAILLVSHDMDHIARLCDEVFLIRGGEIIARGTPGKVVPSYLANLFSASLKDFGPRAENATGRIFELRLLDQNDIPIDMMSEDKDLVVEIGYFAERPINQARAGVGLYHDGRLLFLSENDFVLNGAVGPLWFKVLAPRNLLTRRSYELNVSVRTTDGATPSLAKVAPAAAFKVLGGRVDAAGAAEPAGGAATGALFRAAYPWTVRVMTGT